MNSKSVICFLILLSISPIHLEAQVEEDQMGAWYMYFFDQEFEANAFGFQGDVQFRNWDLGGDLEQLLLRGGVTYRPIGDAVKFTLGYGNITSGSFGDSDATSSESRIYQEALLPHKLSKRIVLKHRFRYEQRWVEGQDLRTRYRYNLFVTIPLSPTSAEKQRLYLSFYNELFINGQKEIGSDREVELFDRNRVYGALGYTVNDNLKIQLGVMRQTLDTFSKNQVQISLHQRFN